MEQNVGGLDRTARLVAGPLLALVGIAGVTAGIVLTVTGRLAGLAFVGGGLLFVHRAFGEASA